ncbi:MAG: hypothetical protein WB952_06545 [Terriglobales bacterium]
MTNDSNYAISGKHKLICYLNFSVAKNGIGGMRNIWETLLTDPLTGRQQAVLGGDVDRYRHSYPVVGTLEPGGDAETDDCLKVISLESGQTACIDLTLIFWYSLETQPDFDQEKDFRYIWNRQWYQEPVGSKTNYCQSFYKGFHSD